MKSEEKKFTETLTFKGLIIGILILVLMVPKVMIVSLIEERQERSNETIDRINAKWSYAQTFCGPVLSIPYSITTGNAKTYKYTLSISPEELDINTELFPEKRSHGIYKTILYKSNIDMSGKFGKIHLDQTDETTVHWDQAYITMGVSDLRGITNNISFSFNGKEYMAEAGASDRLFDKKLIINLHDAEGLQSGKDLKFKCQLNLNGSSNLNFIPIGKTTKVHVNGAWPSPGFIGNFSPSHDISASRFDAQWSILHFNRNIPETWINNDIDSFQETSFGVNLVKTVDHYQQNMRSAKYAIMFIALTFAVFFFVEILTKKRIHPIQYLLVGIALVLFYSLLLSISEQINFSLAYLIASIATIGLISGYVQSIFKNKSQTFIITALLCILYVFLYIILQLEDMSLLIGSIGLFIILGMIMFFSRKIDWYKQDEKKTIE